MELKKIMKHTKYNLLKRTAMVASHAEEWASKVRRYTSLTEHLVKSNPKRTSEPPVIRQGEAERVLKLIAPQVILPSGKLLL